METDRRIEEESRMSGEELGMSFLNMCAARKKEYVMEILRREFQLETHMRPLDFFIAIERERKMLRDFLRESNVSQIVMSEQGLGIEWKRPRKIARRERSFVRAVAQRLGKVFLVKKRYEIIMPTTYVRVDLAVFYELSDAEWEDYIERHISKPVPDLIVHFFDFRRTKTEKKAFLSTVSRALEENRRLSIALVDICSGEYTVLGRECASLSAVFSGILGHKVFFYSPGAFEIVQQRQSSEEEQAEFRAWDSVLAATSVCTECGVSRTLDVYKRPGM